MNRKFMAALICILMMGLTACADEGDDILDIPANVESIPIETEDGEDSSTSDESEEDKTELSGQSNSENELEQNLFEYRAEREKMTNIAMGNGVTGYGAPNAEDYGFQADTASYMQKFDARELNKAYETAKKYVTETLAITVETNAVVYACVDPSITEIYEVEDKGVADGYDSENIFVCEYCDNGTWQYLILVREQKGSEWSVIHHGSSYKE